MTKKLLLLTTLFLALGLTQVFAQCTINGANTTNGFTPASLPCANPGVAYGQALQLHVPLTANFPGIPVTVNVDSVKILSVTGAPAGITVSWNPPVNAIPGGGNGCFWFSGTTNAAAGNYPLTFNARMWGNVLGQAATRDTTLNAVGFNYSLCVQAAQQASSCDTSFNISLSYLTVYGVGNGGYISGNNGYGDVAKAEKFGRTAGKKVVGGYLGFGRVRDSGAADSIWVKLWNDAGTGGRPGAVLDSVRIPLALVNAAIQAQALIFVPFPKQPVLATDSFYIGITLPTTTGDTVALLTDTSKAGGKGRGWEKFDATGNGQWASYANSWFGGAEELGNAIAAAVCDVVAAAPVANFSATPLSSCTTLVSTFTDLSTNTPTTWKWTFTGGTPSSSTLQTPPAVTYSAAGAYNVKLVVTNGNGADSTTKTGYINVYTPPTATTTTVPASSQSATNGSATVVPAGGLSPYTYHWNTNGSNATLANVGAATYSVTVTDSHQCTVTASATVTFTIGINEVTGEMSLIVSPNPTSSVINLQFEKAYQAEGSIYGVNGTLYRKFEVQNMTETINIADLPAGIYTVQVKDLKTLRTATARIVKN